MSFQLADILFPILIFQLLFVSLYLFTLDKGKRISHRLLGCFFLSIALNLADSYFILRDIYDPFPSLALWGSNLILVFGPLLYLYTRSVVIKNFKLDSRYLLHFLPFLIFFLVSMIGYQRLSIPDKRQVLELIRSRQMPSGIYLFSVLLYLHFLIYVLVSFGLIRRFRRVLDQNYSDSYQKNLSWLSYLMIFFMIFLGLGLLNGLISLTSFARFYYGFLFFLVLILFLFINQVLLKALRNPAFFSGVAADELNSREGSRKYPGSTLGFDEKQEIKSKLVKCMKEEKPFLDPALNLDQLASLIGEKPKPVSQVINEQLNQNFFDFVNSYRIEEAKRLLTRPPDKKITVLEVMYEVGFNSKSSFNTLFKKYTGVTPSEFKRTHLE